MSIQQSNYKLYTEEIRKCKIVPGEATDKQTGKPVHYKRLYFDIKHDNGKVKGWGKPNVELWPMTFPRGISFDDKTNKMVGWATFDQNDSDILKGIEIPEMTEASGWVKQEEMTYKKISFKVDHGIAKIDCNILSSPEDENSVVFKLSEGQEVIIEDQQEDYYLIKTIGKKGFFDKFYDDIADLLFENKSALGLGDIRTASQMKDKLKSPVWFPREEETGKIIQSKSPSSWFKLTYFPAKSASGTKRASSERIANFIIPIGKDSDGKPMYKSLSKEQLACKSITCIPRITVTNIYVGAGGIRPQMYITDAVVLDMEDVSGPPLQQEETLSGLLDNKDLLEKLGKQFEESLGMVAEIKNSAAVEEEPVKININIEEKGNKDDKDQEYNLQRVLEGGPVMTTETIDIDDIPGLPEIN